MMRSLNAILTMALCLVLALGLAACGGSNDNGGHKKGTAHYTIGGTATGIIGNVVLQNNGGDNLIINASGPFTFATKVANDKDYAVTVLTQPTNPKQTCTVNNGTGMVQGANVTDIKVICSEQAYTVGGTVTGPIGNVVLQDNDGDDLILFSDGPFAFSTLIANTAGYNITILSSPGVSCALVNATGTVNGANVTDVALSCIPVVSALYPTSGKNWNDYVKNDGVDEFTATDKPCDASTDTSCLHGGEMRVVEVPSESSCAGVTMSEALDAFDWTCDDSTGSVRFISTGLKDGKYLSDLIDFGTPGWKADSVTVNAGGDSYTTAPIAWWKNPVVVNNDGGYLDSAGTIYVVTDDALTPSTGGYIINASSVGLVSQSGVIINGPDTHSNVISSAAQNFIWLECDVDAMGGPNAILLDQSRFSTLRNVTADNAFNAGVNLYTASYNKLIDVTASNNIEGISFGGSSSGNILSDVKVSNNIDGILMINSSNNTLSDVMASNKVVGVALEVSSNNTLTGVTASNNDSHGILIYGSSNNKFSNVTVSSNGFYGVFIIFASNSNTFSGITATNDYQTGISLDGSSYNTFESVTASNNSFDGISLSGSSNNNTFNGFAASNNGQYGVDLDASSNNYFTGPLKVGSNAGVDCFVSGGTTPGLVNATCTTDGTDGSGGVNGFGISNTSDATLTTGVTLSSSFVGKVYDDSVNSSDTGGPVPFPADESMFDWANFENAYRGWGKDVIFNDVSLPGRWKSGNGAIWDWSADKDDTVIKGSLTLPTGNDTLTQIWNGTASNQSDCDSLMPGSVFVGTDDCETTFLRNAVEISGDGIGNDNLLCESGETCLYTPNIASYQGHGNLISAGTFVDGTPPNGITGVTLLKYDTNGR